MVSRLRELAFLNSAANIKFRALPKAGRSQQNGHQNGSAPVETSSSESSAEDSDDEHAGLWQTFHYSGGLREYVKWLNNERQAFHEPIVISRQVWVLL